MSRYRRRLLLANQTEENLYLYGNSVQSGTPTPEAPIDIMSLENPTIKVTGKNLFNKEAVEKLSMYIGTDDWWFSSDSSSFRIKCEPNKSYVISGENPSCTIFRAGYTITDDLPIEGIGVKLYNIKRHSSFSQSIIITTGNDAKYLVVQVNAGAWEQNIEKLQIEEGLNVTKFEPYEEELITIDETTPFGKNLIPYPPRNVASIVVDNKNGTYGVNGTLKAGAYYGVNIIKTNLGDYLEHGKYYTMSLEGLNIPDGFNSIGLYIRCLNKETSANAWPHQCHLTSNGFTKSTFYVDKDKYDYQELFIQINPAEADLTVSDMLVIPMLNEGKEALPFEPYIPPITTMRGIGNYKDRIYTKDGKVWFEQMTAVFENDNSKDEFGIASSPRFYYYFQKPKNSIPSGITQTLQVKNPGLCNYFKYNPQLSENNTIFILSQNAIRAAFFTEDIEDVESWVANKTISVIYPIVKQEPIEITGTLAEKILSIDKSKNITIYSDNGVYGNSEIIEE